MLEPRRGEAGCQLCDALIDDTGLQLKVARFELPCGELPDEPLDSLLMLLPHEVEELPFTVSFREATAPFGDSVESLFSMARALFELRLEQCKLV